MNFPNKILATLDLKAVFDKFYRPLVSYANNFVNSQSECEDIVQDVFVTLWEKHNSFPNEAALKGYLYKSVRNKCLDNLKHRKVRDAYVQNSLQTLRNDDTFLKAVMEEEMARELHEVIEMLSGRKKEIIKLSLRNLKNQDIAVRLNIKLPTVKSLKSKAYKTLRKNLKKKGIHIYHLLFAIQS